MKPADVLEVLEQYDSFLVLGHEEPDADCLASQRVLADWLKRRGRQVFLCSAGPWVRPEIADQAGYFSSAVPDVNSEETLMVVLDCSSPDRTGFSGLPDIRSLVIDHHAAGSPFGDFRWVDPQSPSTTMLVQKLIEASGDALSKEDAELLFLGFCTDTGFFRHIEAGRGESLQAVSRLVDAGASPSAVFRQLAGGRSPGSRQLLGRALERIEQHFSGRLAMTWEHWKDWRELGSERDSDMLYQLMFSIAGTEAAVIVREQSDGFCSVGFRSVTDLDVGEMARSLGGGGHRKASACLVSGDRHDVSEQVLRIFAGQF